MNKILNTTNYIIVNDFRSHPVHAALAIYKAIKKKKKNVKILISEKYLDSDDYGVHLYYFYKLVKFWWLRLCHEVVFIPFNENIILEENDKKGILSSLKSITFDSSASEDNYPSLYKNLCGTAIGAKQIFNFIQNNNAIDKVYIFNGRTAGSYPIVRGCFDEKITVEFYEYADRSDGYKLYPCAPHSTTQLGKAVIKYRCDCLLSPPILFQRAKEWKSKRLTNPYTLFYHNKSEQKFDVVVFLGSDHEYTCLDEDISGYRYIGNYELVKRVFTNYGMNVKIAVRAHPNQTADKNHFEILKNIQDFCVKNNITFFPPKSNISSYDLIKNSEVTVVEFSSIAYDAILLGKKVDLYNDLDLKYFLQSLTMHQLNDVNFVSQYISELMSLYDELYFERFELFRSFSVWFWSRIEWKFLQASRTKLLS